jgi:hypothetical protein
LDLKSVAGDNRVFPEMTVNSCCSVKENKKEVSQ